MTEKDAIYEAAHKGDYDKVVNLLEKTPTLIKTTDSNKRFIIHWAALSGNINLVNHLFELGSAVDPEDDTGLTPFILACSAGKTPIAEILIQKGADINHKNEQGHSALQYASSKGWIEIVKLLIKHNADVNIADIRGATSLHRAASKGNTAIVKLLLECKSIKINQNDAYGNTPLHLACEEERLEEAKILVAKGASLEIKNRDELTPLDMCKVPMARILKEISATRDQ